MWAIGSLTIGGARERCFAIPTSLGSALPLGDFVVRVPQSHLQRQVLRIERPLQLPSSKMQKHTCKLWAGSPGAASLDGDSPTTDLTYKPLPCRAEWRCGSVEGMFDSPFGTGGSSPVPFGERGEISDWSAHDRSSFQSESPARTGRHSQGQKENKSLSLTEVHVPSQKDGVSCGRFDFPVYMRHPKSIQRAIITNRYRCRNARGLAKFRRVSSPLPLDVWSVIVDFLEESEWIYIVLTGHVRMDFLCVYPLSHRCNRHNMPFRPLFPRPDIQHGCDVQGCHRFCRIFCCDMKSYDRIPSQAEVALSLQIGGIERNPGPLPGIMMVEIVEAVTQRLRSEESQEDDDRVLSRDEIQAQLVASGVEQNPGPVAAKKKTWKRVHPEVVGEPIGPKTYAQVAAESPKILPKFIQSVPQTRDYEELDVVFQDDQFFIVDLQGRMRPLAYNLKFLGAAPGRIGSFTEDSMAAIILAHSSIGAKSAHKIRVIPNPDLNTIVIPEVLMPICGSTEAGGEFVLRIARAVVGYRFSLTTQHAQNIAVRKEMADFFPSKPDARQQSMLQYFDSDLVRDCPGALKLFRNRFECLFRPIGGDEADESIPGPQKKPRIRKTLSCSCGVEDADGCCDVCLCGRLGYFVDPASQEQEITSESMLPPTTDRYNSAGIDEARHLLFPFVEGSFCGDARTDEVVFTRAEQKHRANLLREERFHWSTLKEAIRKAMPKADFTTKMFCEAEVEPPKQRVSKRKARNLIFWAQRRKSPLWRKNPDNSLFGMRILKEPLTALRVMAKQNKRADFVELEEENYREACAAWTAAVSGEQDFIGFEENESPLLSISRMFQMATHPVVLTYNGAHLSTHPGRPNPALQIWRAFAQSQPMVAVVSGARVVMEVSTQHHCSIFVMRWLLEHHVHNHSAWNCPHPLASRSRIADVLHAFETFTRVCMHERARRNLGGVIATTTEHIRYREANGVVCIQAFKFKAFDLSTRELEHLCQMFAVTINVPQPNSVFIELDHTRFHCGIFQSSRQVAWYRRHKGCDHLGQPINPIDVAHRLANSFTVAPLTMVPLIIEPHEVPKIIVDAVVTHTCPRHCGVFEDLKPRFSLKRLWNYERTVGNELLAAKTMRKGLIGNLKYSLGMRPLEKGFLKPQPVCSCLIDPVAWLQTGHDTTNGPGVHTIQNPNIEAFINRVVIPASQTEDPMARQAVIMSYLHRLMEKHPFDNNGILNVALEHDPQARVRLSHDNTHIQLIARTIEYRAATMSKEPTMFRDIVLDGRVCAKCPKTNTKCVNGTYLCGDHQLCVTCGMLHDGPCQYVSKPSRVCGCGGYDCKRCRIFDGCYRCGMMVVTRFRGKKVERYCPCCTHESMRMNPRLSPIARGGIGVIMRSGIYPTKPFVLPRLPGLKNGSFQDPKTELKALIDGKWVRVNDTHCLRDDDRCFRAGATLYGLGTSTSVPCVPVLTLKPLLHSMITRQLKDQPVAEAGYFARLEHFVRNNMETIFGPARDIQPTPFHEWVSRFPPARQKQLRRALVMVRSGRFDLKRACERVIFGKNEKLEKGTYRSTSDDFSCRVISSLAGYEASVILGPWMHAFGIELKRIFARGTCMTTACGMDAAELGECFAEAASFENFMDGDHSKFDSTIHYRLLEIEHLVYQHFGLHKFKNAWRVLKHQLTSKFQIKMMINGKIRPVAKGKYYGRRNSGDSNTTTGNTILNALCVIYAGFCASDFTSFDSFYRPENFRAWVVGDDLMLACSSGVFSFADFMQEHAASGLLLESVVRNHPGALTFCGSRSVPCFDGSRKTRLAIPQFERWATKIGWSRDPQPDPDAYVRGLAQCWQSTLCEVPLFGDLVQRYHSLTEGKVREGADYRVQEETQNWKAIPFGTRRVYTEEVVGDVAAGLNVSPRLIQIWRQMIGAVKSLPCVVALPGAELLFTAS